MKKVCVLVMMLSVGFVFFSCSEKKSSSGDDVLVTDSIMVNVNISSFARDEFTADLRHFLKLDYDDYILEVQGNEVKLGIRIKGHSGTVSHEDSLLAESLKDAKLEMALFDDNRTEIGNQRLELSDITMNQIIDWTLQNDYFTNKEITFICKNFSNIEDLKKAKDVKIYAIKTSSTSRSEISNADDSDTMSDNDDSSIDDDDDSSIDDDDDNSGSVSRSSVSEDWDSVLDSYERYVDKYISYMKKAQNGDASALSEYPSLLEEAQEYGEKLQNASGDLSASQLARYNRINAKMLKAAQ